MSNQGLVGKDLVSLLDWEPDDVQRILDVAIEVRANPGHFRSALAGKTLLMYFEKPSLRTRITFEAGMTQTGGHAIYYTASDGKIGVRESVEDVARNLGRWVDAVMCRTFSHQLVCDLAQFASVPVVNGLTDHLHPCQALADYQTLRQVKGRDRKLKLAYVGDGNNVANSLMNGGAQLGIDVTVITPPGYAPQASVVDDARRAAAATGASIEVSEDVGAVAGADAVYTDVWASMGQEEEAQQRRDAFRGYQVDSAMMDRAGGDAVFMHCLPAHRGEEVTTEVADSPRSVIFEQAENRLHAQKALLLLVLGGL